MYVYDNYDLMVERAWDKYCGEASNTMTLAEVMDEVVRAKSVKEAIRLYEKYSEYMESAPDMQIELWREDDVIDTTYSWQYDGEDNGFVEEWLDEDDGVVVRFVVE